MEFNRKMVVTDADNEHAVPVNDIQSTSVALKKRNQRSPFERLFKQLKIILKLARIDAYDTNGHIKGEDGSFMQNSDIIHLITHVMTPRRLLIGEAEFINLLHKAGVEADLIANDNVRSRLLYLYNIKKIESEPREPVVSEYKPPEEMVVDKQSIKRKRDEDANDYKEDEYEEEEDKDIDDYQPPRKRQDLGTTKPSVQWINV
jgi:hypothetical protein